MTGPAAPFGTSAPATPALATPALGTSPLVATIDLGVIAANVGTLARRSGAGVMAVVKADGYGHGAAQVARAALAGGAAGLGVAHVAEALALRGAGIDAPITAWLHTPSTDFAAAVAAGIDIAVSSPRQLARVVAAAGQTGTTAIVTAKTDTGMGRSGVAAGEWDETARGLAAGVAAGSIRMRGLMCHLARGDEPEHPLNSLQADRLDEAHADLRRLGAVPEVVHIANSPATLTRPDLARDLVRPGLAVYGYTPLPDLGDFGLVPALTLTAEIALVKDLAAGSGVSYGHTWIAPADTRIAIIPAGYADGVPRLASGRIEVLIGGRRYRNVGRVCMDQFVVDLGPGSDVAEGDTAVLLGPATGDGPVPQTALDWARASDTIDYEVLTGIGGRRRRQYVNLPGGAHV